VEDRMPRDHILIVDDEEHICTILSKRLSKEGYSCLSTRNGVAALDCLAYKKVWLIITDLRMPHMGGIELLQVVKSLYPEIMVIVSTGYADMDLVTRVKSMGARDCIMKPYDLNSIVKCVRDAERLFQRKNQTDPQIVGRMLSSGIELQRSTGD
jgi:DNA-binding NtrC family response regulator